MDDIIQIYYDPYENTFSDETCEIVENIHRLLSANMVYLIKKKQENMFVYGLEGGMVEIICLPF